MMAIVSFWDGLEFSLLGGAGAAYLGLVLMSHYTLRSRYPLRLDLGHPARSALGLLVWFGVEVLRAGLRGSRSFLDLLSETSAEVGEWFMSRGSPERQAEFRSRFL
jgi:hypothetical protein